MSKRQKNEMQRVWHSSPVDITPWTFFEDEDTWRDLLAAGFVFHVNNVLREELRKHPPELWFPCGWITNDGVGGKCPDDLATLYVTLSLGANIDENVCWSISLEDVVDDLIELSGNEDGICSKVAARLRELANKLDGVDNTDQSSWVKKEQA